MCARKLVYNDKLITEQYTAQEKAEHREKLNNIKEQLPTSYQRSASAVLF